MPRHKPKLSDKPVDMVAKPSASALVVESRKSGQWLGVTYQRAHNRRADGRLSKNAYWRAYWWDTQEGRTRSKYIGLMFRELREDEF